MGGEPQQEPKDFSGFTTKKGQPTGDFRSFGEPLYKEEVKEVNCNVWGQVDFGQGLVSVRCTRVGLHAEHVCSVVITHE